VLPALAAIPGAPIFGIDGALGSGALASKAGTGAISAAINAGSQYVQNGNINWLDVGGSYATGFIGAYDLGGAYKNLAWNVLVNAVNGGGTTAIKNTMNGTSDSIAFGAFSGATASALGFGAGKIADAGFGSLLRPTINGNLAWSNVGQWAGPSGLNIFGPNNWATAGASIGGSIGGEAAGAAINGTKSHMERQK